MPSLTLLTSLLSVLCADSYFSPSSWLSLTLPLRMLAVPDPLLMMFPSVCLSLAGMDSLVFAMFADIVGLGTGNTIISDAINSYLRLSSNKLAALTVNFWTASSTRILVVLVSMYLSSQAVSVFRAVRFRLAS